MFGPSAKPNRILKFEQDGIIQMKMEMFKRLTDSTPLIILEYQTLKEEVQERPTGED